MTFKEYLKVKIEIKEEIKLSKIFAVRRFIANFIGFVRNPVPKSDLIG